MCTKTSSDRSTAWCRTCPVHHLVAGVLVVAAPRRTSGRRHHLLPGPPQQRPGRRRRTGQRLVRERRASWQPRGISTADGPWRSHAATHAAPRQDRPVSPQRAVQQKAMGHQMLRRRLRRRTAEDVAGRASQAKASARCSASDSSDGMGPSTRAATHTGVVVRTRATIGDPRAGAAGRRVGSVEGDSSRSWGGDQSAQPFLSENL